MLRMPSGEIFMNEVKRENSVSFTDNPSRNEITELFKRWAKAEKLIYTSGKTRREYLRKDYI